MNRIWILFLIGLLTANSGNSQTQSELETAFSESYVLEEKESYQEAIVALKKVYRADSYETNLRLGWLYYSAGLLTESLDHYTRCMELRPLSLEARFGYTLPASALGHWDDVLEQYQAILSVDTYNTKANYYVGQIYYYREDYATAEKYFQKVVNLYPFDYDSLLMLAWTKFFMGKSSEAKTLFQKVLLYAPGDESATDGLKRIKQ